jgi:PQQ-dependent dehydrogenase (methanol/ethanol family)
VVETDTSRGFEATPIVVDGRMYVSGPWSLVWALDAGTGEMLWSHDPEVPRETGQKACCDVVNRGVAVYRGKVYVGTLDGRLQALDAETGKLVWSTVTVDQSQPYTITGAPRVAKGKVFIGNGGGEYGVRGYLSAYDAETGELAWRFHTVPGNPADGFENAAMEMAAETWTGEWWQYGGGGTVWDSMAYDPELDLLYVGVGNGSPWNQQIRSPEGGDNLFLSSIVALRPDSGEYVWHYQTTPGETWDYTATQQMILADLEIDGELRQVLMQAPKNGFFYVVDRTDGGLLSAKNYVFVTWATGIDMSTGRPIEAPGARYEDGPAMVMPSALGGHNWHPMAYSPQTGLVYIPAQEIAGVYVADTDFEYQPGQWNNGVEPPSQVSQLRFDMLPAEMQAMFADVPPEAMAAMAQQMLDDIPADLVGGHLLAWDPVAQREVWRFDHGLPWTGGVLATAGGLVFQGSPYGMLGAYDAASGEKLWEMHTGSGVIAAPISYRVGDTQYVAVVSGWGGVFGLLGSSAARAAGVVSEGRILAFALDANEQPPEREEPEQFVVGPIAHDSTPGQIAEGKALYDRYCLVCHGYGAVGGGVIEDLRTKSERIFDNYTAIVIEGRRANKGMPGFDDVLDEEDSDAIRAYVLSRRDLLVAQAGG